MYKSILTTLCFSLALYVAAQDLVPLASVENYQKLPKNAAVRAILIDRQNFKWLGTDKGLFKMASMELDPDLMSNDSICALAEDKKETVWYGTRKDLLINEDQSQNIFLNKDVVISSMAYHGSDIWVGTNKGLFRISDDQNRVLGQFTTKNSKLKSDQINMLFEDQEKRLWVGTDAGVIRIDGKDWDMYEKEHKITGAINTNEGLWLLAETKMWLIYKEDGRERWQDAAVKRGLSKGPVRALASDSKGRIYVASEILVQFDPYTDKAEQIDEDYGFVSSQSFSLACDKNDDLWVGTADRGLFRVDILDGAEEKFSVIAFAKGENKCPTDRKNNLTVIAKGGKTPYSYKWNVAEWKGNKIDSVAKGEYSVTVTDAEGEEYVSSLSVKGPDPITVETIKIEPTSGNGKRDGKSQIKITGGTAPFRILWDNGKTAETVNNLAAGKHSIKIADANQCYATHTVYIPQPKVLPELERSKIAIGQTLRINELYFTADDSTITEESYAVLDEIFQFLNSNRDVQVEIGGHTNNIPADSYCDRLSTSRARAVSEFLYEKGIARDQISYKGYGKRVPIASNETLAGRQKNQRVDIKITSFK